MFGLIACVAILPGQADFLGVIYAFGAMLSFTIAHLVGHDAQGQAPGRRAAVALTRSSLRIRGYELPVLAIFGGSAPARLHRCDGPGPAGAGLRPRVASVGIATLRGLPAPSGPVAHRDPKIVTPEPVVEHEVEYESILVAFEDGHYDKAVVSTAVLLAARRRRGIHVVVTITVPPNSPIDAYDARRGGPRGQLIDSARVRGGRRVSGHWEKVRPGQAGRRIVEEARDIRARASSWRCRPGAPECPCSARRSRRS